MARMWLCKAIRCRLAGPRHLVYPSSAFAYGAHEDNPPLLTEDLPLRPNEGSVMGELKAQSEEEILRWDAPESSVAILRLALVFGREVQVRIGAIDPHGARAEAEFPAIRST